MAAFALAIDIPGEDPNTVSIKGLNDTFCPQCVNPLAKELRQTFKRSKIECDNVSDAVFAFLAGKYAVPSRVSGKQLGEGKFGTVYMGTLGAQEVAIKKIHNQSIQTIVELSVMAKLTSPYIVAFKGFYVDAENNVNIIMERMTGGDLFDFFNAGFEHPPALDAVLHILCNTAKAIECLHTQSPPIVHRDIKLENILLDDKGNAKLADFGTVTFYLDDDNRITSRVDKVGTVQYLPPRDAEVSPALDMYAFGVVCVMMLATMLLTTMSTEEFELFQNTFNAKDTHALLGMVVQRLKLDAALLTAITECLSSDPKQRPRASDMVRLLSETKLPSTRALEDAMEEQTRAVKRLRSEL